MSLLLRPHAQVDDALRDSDGSDEKATAEQPRTDVATAASSSFSSDFETQLLKYKLLLAQAEAKK